MEASVGEIVGPRCRGQRDLLEKGDIYLSEILK